MKAQHDAGRPTSKTKLMKAQHHLKDAAASVVSANRMAGQVPSFIPLGEAKGGGHAAMHARASLALHRCVRIGDTDKADHGCDVRSRQAKKAPGQLPLVSAALSS